MNKKLLKKLAKKGLIINRKIGEKIQLKDTNKQLLITINESQVTQYA